MCTDLDLGDMTLSQSHDTPLGHGQKLLEILSRSDKSVQSYGPDKMGTDGETDGHGDSYIPPNFVCGRWGFINIQMKRCDQDTKFGCVRCDQDHMT